MILVTGATGLVGSHLILHLLQNKKQVRAIFRSDTSKKKTEQIFDLYNQKELFNCIDWIKADINNIPELENAFIDVIEVYHCAAKISFDPKHEEKVRKVNIHGTSNVVNLCIHHNIKKLCHVSSIAALGDFTIENQLINEETFWNPEKLHSDYAISKYGAEMEIWRGQEEGLNIVIVNPGIIFGPGFINKGSGKIITTVSKGIKYYTKGTSGFVGVQDVVKIMFTLMENNYFGERYILVAENISHKELLEIISKKFNVKIPNIHIKPWQTLLFSRIDWLFSTFFNSKRKLPLSIAKSLHTQEKYSNEKIVNRLQYSFESISKVIYKL